MIKKSISVSAVAVLGATLFTACTDPTPAKVEEALTPVPFQQVTLEDEFWLPRLKTQKKTLVPFSLEKTEPAVENLRRTGAYLRGEKIEPLLKWPYYVASDLFKVMEGAAYLLTLEKDPELERQMDEIIDVIAAAQKEDGYLYEHHTVAEKYRNPSNNGGYGPYVRGCYCVLSGHWQAQMVGRSREERTPHQQSVLRGRPQLQRRQTRYAVTRSRRD